MFVVDVSQSTAIAAGSDVDGDGLTGINPYLDRMQQGKYHRDVLSTDPGDTILAAEIGALCGLVREGIPVGHRFGLAVFSGWVHGPAFADAEVISEEDAYVRLLGDGERRKESCDHSEWPDAVLAGCAVPPAQLPRHTARLPCAHTFCLFCLGPKPCVIEWAYRSSMVGGV